MSRSIRAVHRWRPLLASAASSVQPQTGRHSDLRQQPGAAREHRAVDGNTNFRGLLPAGHGEDQSSEGSDLMTTRTRVAQLRRELAAITRRKNELRQFLRNANARIRYHKKRLNEIRGTY